MSISQEKQNHIRIGVDLGGTKIEFVALERDGRELHRHRIATPRFDYEGTVRAVAHAAEGIEKELGRSSSVGMGIPGTISTKTGLVKNANSIWLNGKPFDKDLSRALGREVRCANDANCLVASETARQLASFAHRTSRPSARLRSLSNGFPIIHVEFAFFTKPVFVEMIPGIPTPTVALRPSFFSISRAASAIARTVPS